MKTLTFILSLVVIYLITCFFEDYQKKQVSEAMTVSYGKGWLEGYMAARLNAAFVDNNLTPIDAGLSYKIDSISFNWEHVSKITGQDPRPKICVDCGSCDK